MTKNVDQRAAQINKQLDDVGPDNRGQSSFKSVQKVSAEMIRMDQTSPEPRTIPTTMATANTAHALRQSPRHQKHAGRRMLGSRPKPALHQLVCRIHFPLKISRDQYEGDKNPPDQVSDDQLKKRQVPGIGDSGSADDGERAGFRRDNRKRERPRRRCLSAEEIGVNGLLLLTKMAAVQVMAIRYAMTMNPSSQLNPMGHSAENGFP